MRLPKKIPTEKLTKWDDSVLRWVNHSCEPNAHVDFAVFPPVLMALRYISAGEELTCDYRQPGVNEEPLNCNCKSSNCRGYIG